MFNRNRFISRLSPFIAAAALGLLAQSPSAAPLVNGGFETGDLTGWSLTVFSGTGRGGAGVVSAASGGHSAMISNGGTAQDLTGPGGDSFDPVNFGLPVGVANGAGATIVRFPPCDFLSCGVETFHAATELWQTVSVDRASTLTFDWSFLTNEWLSVFDFGFVAVIGSSSIHAEILARGVGIGTPLNAIAQSEGQYAFTAGAGTTVIELPEAGFYTLVFGAASTEDELIASALLIDNVQITSPVPLPTTLPLLGLGLIGLVFNMRRKPK